MPHTRDTRSSITRAVALALVASLSQTTLGARAVQNGQRATAADTTASTLERGRKALAGGDVATAVGLADRLLARDPVSREAVSLKIEALATVGRDWDTALVAYEAYVKARKAEDAALLRPIARAVLVDIQNRDNSVLVPALQHLACGGSRDAREALSRMRGQPQSPSMALPLLTANATIGNAAALDELKRTAGAGSRGTRVVALRALGDLPAIDIDEIIASALTDQDPALRLTAVDVARTRRTRGAAKQLRALLDDRIFLVRIQAAAALLATGDETGLSLLNAALESEFPDARLAAARGLSEGKTTAWRGVAKALLTNRDGLFRLQAAELLLAVEPDAALGVLRPATSDPNPTVRLEAARILGRVSTPDLAVLRPLLRDESPWVRIEVAGALQKSATGCSG